MAISSSTDSDSNKGIIDTVKDGAMGLLDTILELPMKPKTEAGRKVAQIAFDVAVIVLGLAIFCLMTKTNPFHLTAATWNALAAPTFMKTTAIVMSTLVVSVGVAWVIRDLVGKEHQRTAAKIAAIMLPVLLFGATAALASAGFVNVGLAGASFNAYFIAGVVMFPLGFFALHRAVEASKERDRHIMRQVRTEQRGEAITTKKSQSAGNAKKRIVRKGKGPSSKSRPPSDAPANNNKK